MTTQPLKPWKWFVLLSLGGIVIVAGLACGVKVILRIFG